MTSACDPASRSKAILDANKGVLQRVFLTAEVLLFLLPVSRVTLVPVCDDDTNWEQKFSLCGTKFPLGEERLMCS